MATWILNNYENLYVAAMMILSVIFIVCDMKWYWIPDLLLLILAGIQGLYLSVHTVQPNLAVMAGSVIFMIALHAVAPQQTGSGDVKLFDPVSSDLTTGSEPNLMLVAAFVTGACAALPVRFIKKKYTRSLCSLYFRRVVGCRTMGSVLRGYSFMKKNGYLLTELIVVLALAAIVSTMAAPVAVHRRRNQYAVDTTVSELVTEMRCLRDPVNRKFEVNTEQGNYMYARKNMYLQRIPLQFVRSRHFRKEFRLRERVLYLLTETDARKERRCILLLRRMMSGIKDILSLRPRRGAFERSKNGFIFADALIALSAGLLIFYGRKCLPESCFDFIA